MDAGRSSRSASATIEGRPGGQRRRAAAPRRCARASCGRTGRRRRPRDALVPPAARAVARRSRPRAGSRPEAWWRCRTRTVGLAISRRRAARGGARPATRPVPAALPAVRAARAAERDRRVAGRRPRARAAGARSRASTRRARTAARAARAAGWRGASAAVPPPALVPGALGALIVGARARLPRPPAGAWPAPAARRRHRAAGADGRADPALRGCSSTPPRHRPPTAPPTAPPRLWR